MPTIFLVGAYYPYEGTQAVRAFPTSVEAEKFAKAANDYHETAPRDYRAPDYQVRKKAWQASHPVPLNSACESFEVEEVPFGSPVQGPAS